MNKTTRRVFRGAAVLALGLALGCGAAEDSQRPETVAVSGTVTLQGQPVADATITFLQPDGKHSAVGKTDVEGRYALTTFAPGDGAVSGEYQVQIVKYAAVSEYAAEESSNSEREPLPAKNLLPGKYAGAERSGLVVAVRSDGDNEFDFELR